MKPGDKVTVYEKPYTHEDPEGEAEVIAIKRVEPGLVGTTYGCTVRFDGDEEDETFSRFIFETH